MALKFEYQKSNYGLVNEGIYEMNLTVSLKVTENNKKYINLDFKIRDDVEQENQNRHVWKKIWEKKEAPGTYPMGTFNKILSIQDEKTGKFDFEDYDELLQFINGWNLRCGVKIGEPDEFNEEEYNYISFYSPTKYPTKSLSVTSVENTPSKKINPEDIKDEDLPF